MGAELQGIQDAREQARASITDRFADWADDPNRSHWLPGDSFFHYVLTGSVVDDIAKSPTLAAAKFTAHLAYVGVACAGASYGAVALMEYLAK